MGGKPFKMMVVAGGAMALAACRLDYINFQDQPTPETVGAYESLLSNAGGDISRLPFMEREYLTRVATRIGELRYQEISALPECESMRVKRDIGSGTCQIIEYKNLGQCGRYAKLKTYVTDSGDLPDYQKAARSAMISVARIGIIRYGLYEDYRMAMQSGTLKGLEAFIDRYGLHQQAATLLFPEPCELTEAKELRDKLIFGEAERAERQFKEAGGEDWRTQAIAAWRDAIGKLPFGVIREKALNRQRELEFEEDEANPEEKSS